MDLTSPHPSPHATPYDDPPGGEPIGRPDPFAAAAWYRALDLSERAALLRDAAVGRPAHGDAGRKRLERWRSHGAFAEERVFADRLAVDGLVPDVFQTLLDTPAEVLAALSATPPGWLEELRDAFAGEVDALPELLPGPPSPEWGFLALFAPVVARGVARVESGAEDLRRTGPARAVLPERLVPMLSRPLAMRLYEMVEKTLILELNVARLRGELDGATAEDRFASFVRRLARPEHALPLLAEYPVLARQGVETVGRWERFSVELLRHLVADHADLEATFGPLGALVAVEGDAGDTHRGGRSVQILTFAGGVRLVYKPRSLAVERHFQALLRWLNERGDHPPFRTLTVLDRGSHGWSEFVAAGACTTTAEVERFYRRQGGYLALLYALEANDFHFQNVLAAGEHPVLVDLESLFQQRVLTFDAETASGQASSLIAYSVIRTGLLPQFAWRSGGDQPLELSGLGGAQGQINAGPRAMAEGHGTDEMRMVHREVEFPGGKNRPSLDGAPQSALAWSAAIEEGFESVYRTLLTHRDELLVPGGLIAAFADDPVRVIVRHTQFYRFLVLDCFHPDLQRDALERDRHLDRLWAGSEHRPEVGRLAPLEAEQLRSLDIPMFTTRPASRDLVSASGHRLADHFAEPGLDLVAARLRMLGEGDLARQRWMIGASLRALDAVSAPTPGRRVDLGDVEPVAPGRLIAAAEKVGDRLGELALIGSGGEASWVGISATDEHHYMPASLGPDLYRGLAGIALFLAYLGARTGEARHTALAKAAWRTVGDQLDEATMPGAEMGAYLGTGGVLHTALHLAALGPGGQWPDEPRTGARPLDVVERLLDHLEAAIDEDRLFDVLAGSAGCIPVLLAAHRITGNPRARRLARSCGEHLLATARDMPQGGIAWLSARTGERGLSGFSHGSAGIAWALLTLAAAGAGDRFRDAARAALEHERTLFDPEQRNWRDLRSFLGPDGGFNVAWCNGAAGIGLSRVAILDLLDRSPGNGGLREEVIGDVEHALATTIRAGFTFNHSLCHGALGNLELLSEAGRRLGNERAAGWAGRAATLICDEVEAGNYLCGVPGGFETPGLLDGLAGIGYGLLRLADPEAVPNVLLLEAPRAG